MCALIPALNEQGSVAEAVERLHQTGVDRVVLVDNGSSDGTAARARQAGAEVVLEPRRGYGRACLAGMAHLSVQPPDVLLFMDADLSDVPEEARSLVQPIVDGKADMVIGSRVLGQRMGRVEKGALTPVQQFGNALSCMLMRHIQHAQHTDLGPFRAIRWSALMALHMADENYGWTVEMQVKAANRGLRVVEVPVSYRKRRTGESKVSGNVKGALKAGVKILYTVGRHAGPWGRHQ